MKKYTKFNLQLYVAWWEFRNMLAAFFPTIHIHSLLFVSICCLLCFFVSSTRFHHVAKLICDTFYLHDAPLCECHFCHFKTCLWHRDMVSWEKIRFCYSSGYRIVIKIRCFLCVYFIHDRANIKFLPFPPPCLFTLRFNGSFRKLECKASRMLWPPFFSAQPSWTFINYVEKLFGSRCSSFNYSWFQL